MLAASWPDPEDGMLVELALRMRADAVITRDEQAFNELQAPKYSPASFLEARGFVSVDL